MLKTLLGTVIGVLQGSIGAVHINQASLPSGQRPDRHQIPPVPELYVSRQAVEQTLKELLKANPGGCTWSSYMDSLAQGKTTVGQKVAGELRDDFPAARLWVEVANRSEVDILWDLIDPFEAPPERSPFRPADQYRTLLARLLGSQRVLIILNRVSLQDQERLRHLLPMEAENTAVLVISEARLADLIDPDNSVALPEMTPDEALGLFRAIWKDAFRSTPDEIL